MSSPYLPSYSQIDRQLGLKRCRGILHGGFTCHLSHEGKVEGGVVHWADRRPTRAGIHRYLHLQAMSLMNSGPHWRRYYLAQKQALDWERQLRVRVPASVTRDYRRTLKALIVGVAVEEQLREEAWRWADDD